MFPLAIVVTLIGLWILSANQKSAPVAPDTTTTDIERISYIPIQPEDMDEKDKPMSLRNNCNNTIGSNNNNGANSILNCDMNNNMINNNENLIGTVVSSLPSDNDKCINNDGTIASLPGNCNSYNKPNKKKSAIAPEPAGSISTVSTLTLNSTQSHNTALSGGTNITSATTSSSKIFSPSTGTIGPYNSNGNNNNLQLSSQQQQQNQQQENLQPQPPSGNNTNLLYISTPNVGTPIHIRNIQLPPLRVPGAGGNINKRIPETILDQSIGGSQSLPTNSTTINGTALSSTNNIYDTSGLPPRPNTVDVSTGEVKNVIVDSLILPESSQQEEEEEEDGEDNNGEKHS